MYGRQLLDTQNTCMRSSSSDNTMRTQNEGDDDYRYTSRTNAKRQDWESVFCSRTMGKLDSRRDEYMAASPLPTFPVTCDGRKL